MEAHGCGQGKESRGDLKRKVEPLTVYSLQIMVSLLTIRGWDLEHPVVIKPFFIKKSTNVQIYIITVEVRRDNDDYISTFTFE